MFHNGVWEKKLPPFSGLILVIVLFATISVMTSNVVLFGTKAAAGATPKKVQVTNISDTSFTVTYQTDEPVLGSVTSGKDDTLGTITLDDRDQVLNTPDKHRLHYITVKNLTPGTKYFYAISSGGETFKNDTALYEITTAPVISTPETSQQPLKGQVTLDDGSIPVEGIVTVGTDTSQLLSVMLKPDGSYEIPLNTLRTQDLSARLPLTDTALLNVTVFDPLQQSTAVIPAKEASNAPIMTLSKNYDFSTTIADDAEASTSADVTPALPQSENTAQATGPQITTPQADQSFSEVQPTFDGRAVANATVEITIQSAQEINASVQADANGNWQYKPQTPLEPGNHTIIIKSLDAQGVLQSISQSFTVYAEGSQFVEPSISPPPLPTPVFAPTIPASATPTIEIPTPTVTEAPTPTVVVSTPIPQPTADPNANANGAATPDTGNETWLFGIAGFLFAAGAGALLFFFI